MSDLRPGDRVGDTYTVIEPISRGAMGAVYRARRTDGTEVALKRLIDTGQTERFEIEARLLSRLRHPRVVRVLDHFQEPNGKYLVMELIGGVDLGRVLTARGDPGLPVDEVLTYARQACEALGYVHEQEIVHRDVKPQNLILGDRGVVLVDFGIAREVANEGDAGTRGVGTPRFMAPEVLVGEALLARSDIYSLGATIWTLLAGSPPSYGDPASLTEAVEGVSPSVERTLRRALDPHPERRFGSVSALAAALGAPVKDREGESLARSVAEPLAQRTLLEAIVRTAAGVFEAAASSIALLDPVTNELTYQAAWGAGADEIVGVRLVPGQGIAGAVVDSGEPAVVPACRTDPRFAAQIAAGTGYVPYTMLVVPLERDGQVVGVLSILDRRDGEPYRQADVPRAELFAELTVVAGGEPTPFDRTL